ncbi:MAG: LytTR family DNA-binding domain-containing protein [Bacteroidota bacterium]
MKPVSIKELIQAVDKVIKFRNLKHTAEKYAAYLQEVKATHPPVKLAVATLEGLHFIQFEQIIRLEADGKYTRIILKSQKEILASKNIKAFEQQLPTSHFYRIHRSHLINLMYVRQYIKGEGGYLIMEDGSNLKLAKNRREAFIHRFEK